MAHYRTLRNHGADVALIVGPWTHGEGGGVATRESLDWLSGARLAHPVRIFVTGRRRLRGLARRPPPANRRDAVSPPWGRARRRASRRQRTAALCLRPGRSDTDDRRPDADGVGGRLPRRQRPRRTRGRSPVRDSPPNSRAPGVPT